MSSNRLIYDTCAYETEMTQSVDQLSYILDPTKYYRNEPCRMELGVVGGNNVSQVKGNLVDMETDLRGLTRYNTRCLKNKIHGYSNANKKIKIPADGCKKSLEIDVNKYHLPPCQMIRYEPVPLPPALDMPSCLPPAQQMQFKK